MPIDGNTKDIEYVAGLNSARNDISHLGKYSGSGLFALSHLICGYWVSLPCYIQDLRGPICTLKSQIEHIFI